MFKNFHIQFDAEKKIISFFTNDTNILELKKESNSDNISTILIIFFVILGILLIGAGVFLYKKSIRVYIKNSLNIQDLKKKVIMH